MQDLIIEGKRRDYFIPSVHFRAADGLCSLSGESYLEQADFFYAQLQDWLKMYTEQAKGPITFEFRLEYFNTTSMRYILDMLIQLREYEESGGEVSVRWFYPEWDEEMLKDGEDFQNQTKLENFVFIEVPDEDGEEEL